MDEAAEQEVPEFSGGDEGNEPFVGLLLERWLGIAAVAWDGFWTQGRGVVVLTEGHGDPTWTYHPGSPCSCHQEMVEGYDPEYQVVIAHCGKDDGICCINVFGGWPAPPHAATSASATQCGATLN